MYVLHACQPVYFACTCAFCLCVSVYTRIHELTSEFVHYCACAFWHLNECVCVCVARACLRVCLTDRGVSVSLSLAGEAVIDLRPILWMRLFWQPGVLFIKWVCAFCWREVLTGECKPVFINPWHAPGIHTSPSHQATTGHPAATSRIHFNPGNKTL